MMALQLVQIAMLVIVLALVVRVWRSSPLHALLSLFVPLYMLVPMIKYRDDPDSDIRWHVALFFCGAIATVWMEYRFAQQLGAFDDGAQVAPHVRIDVARVEQTAPSSIPAAAQPTVVEPSDAPRPRAPVAPPTPREALALATFLRGRFERSTMGFSIDIPEHFHALSASDARRIEASQKLSADSHEVAWVSHESVQLDAADAWHVSVRWLGDGWVASDGAFDARQLLQQARSGEPAARLAGSGGDLVGYAVAPSYADAVADWVEERVPHGAAASVLDCHAVRLGRRGVVEFSVVGVPMGSQTLCDASVRLLARQTHFDAGADYATPPAAAGRAAYRLSQLVAGVR